LQKTEKLQSLALLWVNLVDTLDTNNKGQFGLGINVERSLLLRSTSKSNLLTLCVAVLLDVGLGTLEDGLALLLVGLLRDNQLMSLRQSSMESCFNLAISDPKDG
jgi:hypothetical protein